jgi:hypothetical protein
MIWSQFLRKHWGKLLLALLALYFLGFVDDAEQALGLTSQRMARVQRIGRLAPFPKERCNFRLWFSAGLFHSAWMGSFSASAENVTEWLKESPGVQEGDKTHANFSSTRYVLRTNSFPGYIDVSSDGSQVSFIIGRTLDPLPEPRGVNSE